MNRKYAKPLFKLIESRWPHRWASYKKLAGGTTVGRTFRQLIEGGGAAFVFLWVDPKGAERFFCEFGWSASGEPPVRRAGYGFPMQAPQMAFSQPEMVAGIQALWGDSGIGAWQVPDPVETFDPSQFNGNEEAAAKDFLARLQRKNSLTDAEAEALVAPLVDNLLERLDNLVLPYLQEYVAAVAAKNRGS